MKALILLLCSSLVAGVFCHPVSAEILTARSSTGQFFATEIRSLRYPGQSPKPVRAQMAGTWGYILVAPRNPSNTDETNLDLEPSLLVVTCERLKSHFLQEMGLDDDWKGKVNLLINPALAESSRPQLTAEYHPDGWRYNITLPKTITKRLLVRVVVDTLFLEVANRNAGSHSAQIPFWLYEGMGAHLQSFTLPTDLLQPSEQMTGANFRLKGLQTVRQELREHPPLSFQQLSWPTEVDADGPEGELFRSCAQLFLEQLLQLKDGNRLLAKMLHELPGDYNWQTAFLSAFRPHFHQLLDVEKWWGLSAVNFARGDIAEPLKSDNCAKELRNALDVPVLVHFASQRLPAEAKITLQEVIQKWPEGDAHLALQQCMEQLRFLHFRAPPEYRPLVDQYLKVLATYAKAIQQPGLEWTAGKNHPSALAFLKSDAATQLDGLDRQRAALRVSATATASNTR
ncbi:MAG TPA: hypothetical protein VGO67_00730 [Verrucomicrobiae bacterium]